MKKIEPERIRRVARIYASNQEASRALGIAPGSFSRLCRLYGIETPYARRHRRREEWRKIEELDEFPMVELDETDLEDIAQFQNDLDMRAWK